MSPLHILSAIAIVVVLIGMAYPSHYYAVACAVILLAVCNFLK